MFRFAHPTYLYGLLLIPVLAALFLLLNWRRRRQLREYGDPQLLENLMTDVSPAR